MLGGITMDKMFRLLPLLLLICGLYFFPVASVFADDDTSQKEIDITLAPLDILFAINDMKPGDWAPRTLTVKNSGSKDFFYQISVQNKGGKKLFNELILEVSIGGSELYRGKLSAFTSLPSRKLGSGSSENLDITIRFPEHLGNDFQGTDSMFDFIITAEGKDGDKESVTIPGEVGNDDGAKPPGIITDSTDEKSNPTTPAESSNSESNSAGETSEDSGVVLTEKSLSNTDPPESSSTSSLAELPSISDSTATAKTPATSILPATSTNLFNLLFVGSVLVALGIVLMLVMHYRRLKLVHKLK